MLCRDEDEGHRGNAESRRQTAARSCGRAGEGSRGNLGLAPVNGTRCEQLTGWVRQAYKVQCRVGLEGFAGLLRHVTRVNLKNSGWNFPKSSKSRMC